MPRNSKNSLFVKNLLIVTAVSLAALYTYQHLKITPTNSLSKRVFWSNPVDGARAVKTGEYVIFDQYVPKPYFRMVSFIKRAGCAAGDVLKVDQDDYYCNGQYLGHAKRKSLKGEPMIPFVFNGIVPKDMIFAVGDHPDSYDSRYVGFISRERIKRVAWALF